MIGICLKRIRINDASHDHKIMLPRWGWGWQLQS